MKRRNVTLIPNDKLDGYQLPKEVPKVESELKKVDAMKMESSVPVKVSYYSNPFSNTGVKQIAVDLVSYGVGSSVFGDGINGSRFLTFGLVDALRLAFFDPTFKRMMNTDATKDISDNLEDGIGLFIGGTAGLYLASMFKLGGERSLGSIMKEMLTTAAVSTAGSFLLPTFLKS